MFALSLDVGLFLGSRKRSLLVGVLGRRDQDILGVGFEDEDVVDIFIVTPARAAESAGEEDGHDPDHPEEHADAATQHESDCAAFPGAQDHERPMHAMQEGNIVVTGVTNATVASDVNDAIVHWVGTGMDELDGQGLDPAVRSFIVRLRGNEWKTEGLSKLVGDGKSFVLHLRAKVLAASARLGFDDFRKMGKGSDERSNDRGAVIPVNVGRNILARGYYDYAKGASSRILDEASSCE